MWESVTNSKGLCPTWPPREKNKTATGVGRQHAHARAHTSPYSRNRALTLPTHTPHTWVSASVLDISSENTSDAASWVNGAASPSARARPIAIAVLPVPGWPASRTPRPAMRPALTSCRMTPIACFFWARQYFFFFVSGSVKRNRSERGRPRGNERGQRFAHRSADHEGCKTGVQACITPAAGRHGRRSS
jgi:hypothetical protein